MRISFFVPGIPKPAGSKRAFVRGGRAIITEDCKTSKDWRGDVKRFAVDAVTQQYTGTDAWQTLDGPLSLHVVFYMQRPKNHYRKNGELKPDAPYHHAKRPDATKLLRGLEDALTGILWGDDAQIVRQEVEKRYIGLGRNSPGAWVSVESIEARV